MHNNERCYRTLDRIKYAIQERVNKYWEAVECSTIEEQEFRESLEKYAERLLLSPEIDDQYIPELIAKFKL